MVQSELSEQRQLSMALQMNQVTWQNKYSDLEDKFKEYKKNKELVRVHSNHPVLNFTV
jgi:hypothetical protein